MNFNDAIKNFLPKESLIFPLIPDNIEEAYREYAKAISKHIEELTTTEKQQAIINALLSEVDNKSI